MWKRQFKDAHGPYRVLIVADKFQTGFDERRLCAMYVDKKLSGVATVQTLWRLNRICDGKTDPIVLDFVKDPAKVLEDFQLYYKSDSLPDNVDHPSCLRSPTTSTQLASTPRLTWMRSPKTISKPNTPSVPSVTTTNLPQVSPWCRTGH